MKDLVKKIWNWIVSVPKDKLLHDYAAALITLYTFAVAFLWLGFWPAFVLADAVAAAALFGKGIYDYYNPDIHTMEIGDFIFGCFGVLKVDIALLVLAAVLT